MNNLVDWCLTLLRIHTRLKMSENSTTNGTDLSTEGSKILSSGRSTWFNILSSTQGSNVTNSQDIIVAPINVTLNKMTNENNSITSILNITSWPIETDEELPTPDTSDETLYVWFIIIIGLMVILVMAYFIIQNAVQSSSDIKFKPVVKPTEPKPVENAEDMVKTPRSPLTPETKLRTDSDSSDSNEDDREETNNTLQDLIKTAVGIESPTNSVVSDSKTRSEESADTITLITNKIIKDKDNRNKT